MQFGIRSAVLNSELPQNSRIHILEVCKHSKQFILQLDNGLYLLMLSAGFSVRITFHKILTTFICQQEFNAGLFDYLIATDDSKIKENEDNEKKNIEPRNSKNMLNPKLTLNLEWCEELTSRMYTQYVISIPVAMGLSITLLNLETAVVSGI